MTKLKSISKINTWFDGLNEPLIIAGPCSAESEEQVMQTAKEINALGKIKVYRSGIWKPRTRPGNFEGVGEEGLRWLQQVKKETGLLTAVEVANPEHAALAIKYDVDILWIGARTTSNPFSVQELADYLKAYDKPVMVKNPINPDVNLWVGALERFHKAGINKLAAVHRGFYPFEATTLRNIPKWEVPIELKSICHDLPIICDPSHIAGNTEYIPEVAQKALDLNMDGLMIETHFNPKLALSDMNQQLTPQQLGNLLDKLIFRSTTTKDTDFAGILETLRSQIDSIDQQMLELLSQRMNIVEEIGIYKSKNEVTILQLRRWEKIITTRLKLGKSLGLSEDFVKKLLQLVHKESIQRQTEVMSKIASSEMKNK
ncbi:MAG: bifunctional 3-deoxy-7-phosphoheptulonate synthase/chorismate mutase type II [Bacteroidales bacterium]|nr:bifunctional 3-deoxy-7-phosphoheptulonate synthase/chorismate mutase type II [Bacteroidales bacterium]